MSNYLFASRKHLILNCLLIGILLVSVLAYWYISIIEPDLNYIFILAFLDFPILGYILLINNTIKFTLSEDLLKINWFGGSREIELQNILGYFNYTDPLFEFHLEASYIGARLKRNAIGYFYYFSPGIRKGLILEYKEGSEIEKIFIVPKNINKFIDTLRLILLHNYNRKIDEYKGKYFIK